MTDAVIVAQQFDDAEQQRTASDLGIWVFLASEILFFGVLFAAYTFTRLRYPEAFAAGSRLTNVTLGSINTGVLLTSSLTMALAVRSAKSGARKLTVRFLYATMALGLIFLAIKGAEYYLDYTEHLVPGFNFAYSGPHAAQVELFFYLYFFTTGVHSLHMIIGICVVAVIATMASRGAFSPGYFTPVEVSGLYWHLVDIVWIFLYPLLYLVSRT
ncbi:MAG: cytochrome c oxidase subunit 3 family protein [Burkholderiaceae bacterium]